MDDKKSLYDPSRHTVGKIYRDLKLQDDHTPILVGDMANEIMKDYVEDLNDALKSNPYEDKPFYILIHEKKDLQMKDCGLRRVIFFPYRPWPEDNSDVYWTDPKTHEVRFCWSLPHWSEMENMIIMAHQYAPELIADVLAWREFDIGHFGFYYANDDLKWIPKTTQNDRKISKAQALASVH